jgi:SSS family transporter
MPPTSVAFGALNYLALGAYLIGTLSLGLWFARRNRSTTDYFSAGRRIPWWVMGISISNVSSISYMSIPAKAYAENWTIFWVNVPIVLLAPVVILVLLPVFARLRSASAYEFLETRFGLGARLYGATAFVLLQLGRMALVIYLPALALAAVTDLNVIACIMLIGAVSALYSVVGGIEGVVWTDFAQTVFLIGAALLSFALIVWRLDGGFGTLVQVASEHDKFRSIRWSGDYTTTAIWVVLLGSLFSQAVPYISDQSMIQRYQTTTDVAAAGRALWTNAGIAMINTCLLLGVGTAMFVYYRQFPSHLAGLPKADAILPFFIARELPPGVAGLVVAGIFAAAQSAISTSLNSTSTVIVTDFLQRLGPPRDDAYWLRRARVITAVAGVVAVTLACLLAVTPMESAFDFFQRLLGLTSSGLAGLFILGIFTRRTRTAGALTGAVTSALVLYLVQTQTKMHVYLYALTGIGVCVLVGYTVSVLLTALRPPPPAAGQP